MIELSPKFRPLISESSRYTVVTGGRGSSKSFSVSLYLLLKTFEVDQVILFSRYTMTSAHLSVIPEFLEKIEMLNLDSLFEITKTEIINKTTGSRILFRGLKTGAKIQTAALKSIAGLTIWVLDEAEELNNEELFDDIARSIRKKGVENKIILVFNPPTKSHWTYNRFFLSKGVEPGMNITQDNVTYIHTDYTDNIDNLNKDFVQEAEDLKYSNREKWDRVYAGAYREVAEGVIFNNVSVGNFPEGVSVEYGLDFGFSKDPTALIKVHMDRQNKIIYCKEELYKTGITPSQLARIIKEKVPGNELIIADNARPDIIQEIKNSFINIKPCKKTKIVEGINIMKDYKIIVDPSSKNLMEEFNNYCWDKNYDDRAIDDWNHQIDSLRYYITYRHRKNVTDRYSIY